RRANSRDRDAVRASIRPATFAHPIIKTRPAAPNSIQSIVRTFSTSWSFSGVSMLGELGFASSISGCALAYRVLKTANSAPARSRLTCGRNRPNTLNTGLFKVEAGTFPEGGSGGRVTHISKPGAGKLKPDGKTPMTV